MKLGNICEVTQNFAIEISKSNSDIPLEFNLYKDVNCTEIVEKNDNGIFTAEDFKLKAGEEQTKNCYLKISWPADENNMEMAYEIGYFTLNIMVTQVD